MRHGYYPEDVRVYKEVRALHEAGYSVDVICLRKPGEQHREILDGVRVYRLFHGHRRGSSLRYIFEYGVSFFVMGILLTVLYFWRLYAVIQVNTMPDALAFITVIPRLFGAKVLLDMHEPTPELWITKYGEDRYRILLKLQIKIEQLAIKYVAKVITVNDTVRKRFIERGADGGKIEVIRNVPDDRFGKESSLLKTAKDFTLITHGTIEKRYGQETIIRALPLLREQIDNLQLYIVGAGEGAERLHTLSKELNCVDTITFTGHVSFSQVGEIISCADIGLVALLPTPFGELCQPNKLFEYVALRKPVVVPRLKAIQESFDDSCVTYFEPGNHEDLACKILEIYINPQKAKELAKNAYLKYEEMNWNKAKRSYLKIVESLVENIRL